MTSFHKALALAIAVVLAAPVVPLAAQPAKADEHAVHHPAGAASMPMPVQDARMQAMRDMRDRMAAAKTPEERQALMTSHMKTMVDGMQMMKGMSGMSGMGASGGMPMSGQKAGAKGMPADMAKHHQMMEARMEAMQTMMEMMMQRMPAVPVQGK
ncbi:MAG: hypothetical protein V9G29_05885 [Burkholderiaceae bacterium]